MYHPFNRSLPFGFLGLIALLACTLLTFSGVATAAPEDDRKQLIELYRSKFPDKKLEDYVHGALMFSPDAKAQYESMMDMPPWEDTLAKGKTMWEKPFKNGKTLAGCFPDGGKNVAGNYPAYDKALKKVVTFEMAINKCYRENGEPELKYSDMATMGVVSLYGHSLSDGMKMNVKVDGADATTAYEAGKKFFYQRRGQLNFACAHCHVGNAGDHVRSEFLSPVTGQATHWPLFRGVGSPGDLFTLQRRYAACAGLVRSSPSDLGGEDYNNLQYFHAYQSNGMPLKAGVWRK